MFKIYLHKKRDFYLKRMFWEMWEFFCCICFKTIFTDKIWNDLSLFDIVRFLENVKICCFVLDLCWGVIIPTKGFNSNLSQLENQKSCVHK